MNGLSYHPPTLMEHRANTHGVFLERATAWVRDTDITKECCVQWEGYQSTGNAFLNKGEGLQRIEEREKL